MSHMIRYVTLLCTLIVLSFQVAPAGAQTLTESQAAAIGEGFVAGVNSDSKVHRLDLIRSIYARSVIQELGEERLDDLFTRLRSNYGRLTHHHTEIVGRALHLYAQSTTDSNWHDFQFRVETGDSLKLMQIIFIADVTEPVYLPNGVIDDPFTLDWLNRYIDGLAKTEDLAAAVLLARGDSIFLERYVGHADAARTRLVNSNTRFNLGSGNKMFTAAAIMQLREDGKIALTDTLSRFFPDFPNQKFITTATVHHLLSHTSGLGDYLDENYKKNCTSISELEQFMPYVCDDEIGFRPGTQFQYSNSGFVLAGLIVEKVSGDNYFEYVRENVYRPLGMLDTDSYMRDGTEPDLAEPLVRAGTGWATALLGKRGSSAGGGYSTPRDMLRWARGITTGNVLSRKSLDEMIRPKTAELDDLYPYGYGFTLNMRRGRVISFGHGGMAPGINLEFQYFPDEDITFVMFCNQDNGAFDDLRKNIMKLITGDR